MQLGYGVPDQSLQWCGTETADAHLSTAAAYEEYMLLCVHVSPRVRLCMRPWPGNCQDGWLRPTCRLDKRRISLPAELVDPKSLRALGRAPATINIVGSLDSHTSLGNGSPRTHAAEWRAQIRGQSLQVKRYIVRTVEAPSIRHYDVASATAATGVCFDLSG